MSPDGNNSNNGTAPEYAWKNISNATLRLQAGDTLNILNGTYYGEYDITFPNNGTTSSPITIMGYNGNPIIDGQWNNSGETYGFRGGYYTGEYYSRQYIVLKNFTIRGYRWAIIFRNSNNININNVTVHIPDAGKGIYFIDGNSNSLIDNVTVIGNGWNQIGIQGRYNTSGVWYGVENSNITVSNSYFYNNSIHVGIDIAGNNSRIYINNNYFENFTGTQAIYFHVGYPTDIYVKNNTIYNVNYGIESAAGAGNTNNLTIENNTITNASERYIKIDYVDNSTIRNNYIRGNSLQSEMTSVTGVNILFENNDFYSQFNKIEYRINVGTGIIRNPIGSLFKIMSTNNASINLDYTDGKIFKENGKNNPTWYPDKSNYSIGLNEIVTITTYPMSARPTTSSATVTVNSFNTSLPAGQVLVNFTANTTNGNNVHFTISTLTPGRNYTIKKGSSNFMDVIADGSGTIAFDNSVWPSGAFTVRESVEQGSGNASGIAIRMNLTPIPSANISLYYQNGMAYGLTVRSGADGRFTFSNITNGNYYVVVDKQLFRQNTSSVFNINSNSKDIGSIKAMCYDVNGDNNIDVLDLNMIGQRMNEITGTSYPAVDVNGDGEVDVLDLYIVAEGLDR
ncbi:MAG: dockerin type I domain-containing protein [Candidatus Methanoperedens sp.]|nr:dockerin type I domain-containing protein [Candidatus Methanoperedens sp.]